jgi:hypothetical protein
MRCRTVKQVAAIVLTLELVVPLTVLLQKLEERF